MFEERRDGVRNENNTAATTYPETQDKTGLAVLMRVNPGRPPVQAVHLTVPGTRQRMTQKEVDQERVQEILKRTDVT